MLGASGGRADQVYGPQQLARQIQLVAADKSASVLILYHSKTCE